MSSDVIAAISAWASKERLSLAESFLRSASEYRTVIGESKRLIALTPSQKNVILAIVAERASSMARAAGRRVVTAEDFMSALLEFKGYKPDPWDRCEGAAVKIAANLRTYQARLSESLRSALQD
jgi:hypothetical protein